jgi:hypothetical protein
MAKGSVGKVLKKADPMKTKTGKTRLGPLNIRQLNELLEKTAAKKEKARIRNELARRAA